MSKDTDSPRGQEFAHPFVEQEPSRGLGLLLALVVLTIVGIAIWLIVNHDETS